MGTLCTEVGKMMSVTVTTKTCSIATTCSTRRRLADERRLTVNANSQFTVSGLTPTQASNGATAIAGTSVSALTTAINTAISADSSLNVTVSGVQSVAKPTVTDTSSVSAAVALGSCRCWFLRAQHMSSDFD